MLADLLGTQHLFEILQTALTFQNSKKVVKSGVSKNVFAGKRQIFFQMIERYEVSCVKILMFWYITRRSVFI